MSLPPIGHGNNANMRSEEYIVEFSFAFQFISTPPRVQEHHDISVIGYGDILPELFEETPSMATVALCALRITIRHLLP